MGKGVKMMTEEEVQACLAALVRRAKVEEVQRALKSGVYEYEKKLNIAIDRLLEALNEGSNHE